MKLEDEKIVAMCKDTAQVEIGIRHLIHKYKEKLYWQIKTHRRASRRYRGSIAECVDKNLAKYRGI
jgi:hypothetical protein